MNHFFYWLLDLLFTISPFQLQAGSRYGRGAYYALDGEEKDDVPVFVYVIATVLIIGVVFLFLSILYTAFKHVFSNLLYNMGMSTFSKMYRPTPSNKRFAYKVIGCHMIAAERGGGAAQYRYLVSYLRSRYTIKTKLETKYIMVLHKDFEDVRKPLLWLKMVEPKEDHIKIIDFLANLAFFNDRLTKGEVNLIYKAGDILEIPRNEVKAILTIRFNHQRKRKEQQKNTSSSTRRTVSSAQQKHNALNVLGLNAGNTSFEEVRRAYRRLAAIHHPDRFANQSKDDQQRAHERFVEIKLAYEYLVEILKK
jgi:DnaJ-domain-containing protein 1